MKLIIAGSRGITNYYFVARLLNKEVLPLNISEVVCGMADGVDTCGWLWAKHKGIPIKEMPAKWQDLDVPGAIVKQNKKGVFYNVLAGKMRNLEMLKYADKAYIFWDGKSPGTKHTIEEAEKMNKLLKYYVFEI